MADYTVLSPATTTISERAQIGAGVVIYPNNHILGDSRIGDNAVLYPNNVIEDSTIGAGAELTASVVRGAIVGKNAKIGPFSHLRPGAIVGENCRVGNYTEIKNAVVGAGTKIAHLTYVGDADIGKNCNIGCGVVFCNYDGARKHRASVEDECFLGSNVNLIAPVRVGAGSFIAAGTTLTRSVPAGSFVIGRVRQESKAGGAQKYVPRGGKHG